VTGIAKDIMSAGVVTVTDTRDLREVAKALVEERITGAPVVDEMGNLVGSFRRVISWSTTFRPSMSSRWRRPSIGVPSTMPCSRRVGRMPQLRGRYTQSYWGCVTEARESHGGDPLTGGPGTAVCVA
jgi:hypothetical protein